MQDTPRYKLAAFDMDDTLLRPDGSLSDYAAEVLRSAEKKGVKILPCTGRPYDGAVKHLKKINLDTCGVFCNGAQIRRTLSGEILHECPMPPGDAGLVADVCAEAGGHPRVYVNDRVYVTQLNEEDKLYANKTGSILEPVGDLRAFIGKLGRQPLKILNQMPTAESIPPLCERNRQVFGDRLNITQSHSVYLEYMHRDATKGNGLKKMADMWGISKEEIVVAGDYLNDLAMFREAGFSIAPQNAHPDVLQAASCVCLGNAEDGVAKKFAEIFGVQI